MTRLLVVAAVLWASVADAKPLGAYWVHDDCLTRPAWIEISTLDAGQPHRFDAAAACSEITGIRWILIGDVHPGVLPAIEAAGLRPHLIAISYYEEWYAWARMGWLDGSVVLGGAAYQDDPMRAIERVRDFTAARIGEAKAAFGLPVLVVDNFWNNSAAFGPQWWNPVPDGADALGLSAYGADFTRDIEPYLRHALVTSPLPIVLIPQTFETWWAPMSIDVLAGHARWLSHPRVAGALAFAWAGQYGPCPDGMTCLRDLPHWRAVIGGEQ